MPRTPTTIRVVPSRLAWAGQWLLALAVSGALLRYAPGWLAVPALAWLGPLGWWLWRGQARGQLHMLPEPDGGWRWLWQPTLAAEAQPAGLRCRYLGPWLIGLKMDGRKVWLWPDSAPRQELRQLRRALVH